jgi:hypothetical protein
VRYDNGGAFERVDVCRPMEMAKAILQIMDRRKVEVYTGAHVVHRTEEYLYYVERNIKYMSRVVEYIRSLFVTENHASYV